MPLACPVVVRLWDIVCECDNQDKAPNYLKDQVNVKKFSLELLPLPVFSVGSV